MKNAFLVVDEDRARFLYVSSSVLSKCFCFGKLAGGTVEDCLLLGEGGIARDHSAVLNMRKPLIELNEGYRC